MTHPPTPKSSPAAMPNPSPGQGPVRRRVGAKPLELPPGVRRPPKPDAAPTSTPVSFPPSAKPPARPIWQTPGTPSSYPPAGENQATRVTPARRTAGPARKLDASAPTSAAASDYVPPRQAGRPQFGADPRRGPVAPPGGPSAPYAPPRKRPRRRRRALLVVTLLAVFLLAWPVGLALWANSKLQHVDALHPGGDDSGRTYLIAGSDLRGSGGVRDDAEGARADTIMVLHAPPKGHASLLSIPRDTYVEIPGYGGQKINAAYAFGGPELLVETVQNLTGMHVDHYVEVGFGSLTDLVNAVGGVKLCYDQTVNDKNSKLNWEAGCHQADGATALAFSRMRYSDPLGDIGRAERQRQVVGQIAKKAFNPKELLWPGRQISLVNAGTGALRFDQEANILNVGRLALDFKKATGPDGASGTPTIESTDYRPGNIGSAVKLNDEAAKADFSAIREGTWEGNKGSG